MNNTPSNEELQKAKDFLWEHLENASKELLLHIANTNTMADNGLTVKRLTINRNLIVGIDSQITK